MRSSADPERGSDGGNHKGPRPSSPAPPPHAPTSSGRSLPPPPQYYYREVPDPLLRRRHTSWLVPLLLIANIAVFVVTMSVNNCPANRKPTDDKCLWGRLKRFSFQPLRENPLLGPSSRTLEKMGALQWEKVVHQHQGWRLVTCIWLHGGVIHLVANMLSLAFIGIRLEQQFGYVRIGIIYLFSGFGGSILSVLFIQNRLYDISVGASGALFGLLGAMLSELLTNWTIYSDKAAAFITLTTVIIINLVVGILPRVDNFSHIGGFLTGFFLGFILLIQPRFSWMEHRRTSKYNAFQLISLAISVCLLIAGFVFGLVMLYREVDPDDHCKWCHYLSCVPTSSWKCDSNT